jgi:hypothetical protein
MRTVSVSRKARVPAAVVIDALWSGADWRASWSGIKRFDIDYDDGEHQAARLEVDWNGEPRTLSLARFRESFDTIAFFCPSAPPPLSCQTGWWTARSLPGGSLVTATRCLDLAPLPGETEAACTARFDAYETTLRTRLGQILENFSVRLATDHAAQAVS